MPPVPAAALQMPRVCGLFGTLLWCIAPSTLLSMFSVCTYNRSRAGWAFRSLSRCVASRCSNHGCEQAGLSLLCQTVPCSCAPSSPVHGRPTKQTRSAPPEEHKKRAFASLHLHNLKKPREMNIAKRYDDPEAVAAYHNMREITPDAHCLVGGKETRRKLDRDEVVLVTCARRNASLRGSDSASERDRLYHSFLVRLRGKATGRQPETASKQAHSVKRCSKAVHSGSTSLVLVNMARLEQQRACRRFTRGSAPHRHRAPPPIKAALEQNNRASKRPYKGHRNDAELARSRRRAKGDAFDEPFRMISGSSNSVIEINFNFKRGRTSSTINRHGESSARTWNMDCPFRFD